MVTLHERASQALESGNSLSSSTRASASLILGIVSKAMRSAPAAAKDSMCGRCQTLSSLEKKKESREHLTPPIIHVKARVEQILGRTTALCEKVV